MPEAIDLARPLDLILFAGQSNMAGRGISTPLFPHIPPPVPDEYGLEFRAVSDPTCLHEIREPFGDKENRPGGIFEHRKTGSMVSSFIRAYAQVTGATVIAVSASKGGSAIGEWQKGTPFLTDALDRLRMAMSFLSSHNLPIRHVFTLWCQGESDGDLGTGEEEYLRCLTETFREMQKAGITDMFLIKTGMCNLPEAPGRYDGIRRAQETFVRLEPRAHMASRLLGTMRERGLMKDAFHYVQEGYNECGRDAGFRAGRMVLEMNEEYENTTEGGGDA
ncbi:MAG: hypothetical protein IJ083_18280 [Clostridia bacterium]|nr:hypothetical protein [Clostridia bacterium]